MFTPTKKENEKKGDEDKEEKFEDEGTSFTTMHRRDDKDDPTGGSGIGSQRRNDGEEPSGEYR